MTSVPQEKVQAAEEMLKEEEAAKKTKKKAAASAKRGKKTKKEKVEPNRDLAKERAELREARRLEREVYIYSNLALQCNSC